MDRGIKNVTNLGNILEFDGESEVNVWNGDKCNQIVGTDTTIFAPYKKKGEPLWIFEQSVCRSFAATYTGKDNTFRGIPTAMYTLEFDDIANDPELQCFCRSDDHCPVKGTIDLFPCLEVPIVGSKPHFLDADPALLSKVNGLNPNWDDHAVYVHFEMVCKYYHPFNFFLIFSNLIDVSLFLHR